MNYKIKQSELGFRNLNTNLFLNVQNYTYPNLRHI